VFRVDCDRVLDVLDEVGRLAGALPTGDERSSFEVVRVVEGPTDFFLKRPKTRTNALINAAIAVRRASQAGRLREPEE